MKKTKFGVGLLLGAVVGAVAGILAAPKSGKETRDDLKRRADTIKEDAQNKLNTMKSRVNRASDDAKQEAEDIKGRVEHAADAIKTDLTEDSREPITKRSIK